MYDESDYIMLSALQHYMFCPRQCALIHIEQLWAENRYTAEGNLLHQRVDSEKSEQKGKIRIVRTLPICSAVFGLSGQADVVEFHENDKVFPVEYKRGRPKKDQCDEVQLCAQALCLEEMLNVEILEGALFYGMKKRRKQVVFNTHLRELTIEVIHKTHALIERGKTPAGRYEKKCDACSLKGLCLPKVCGRPRKIGPYLKRMLGES